MSSKICYTCKREKLFSEFNTHAKHTDGLASSCKDCAREYQKEWYAKNKETRIPQILKIKERNKKYILGIKRKSMCKICREDHPAILEFHHRDPKKKELSIAEVSRHGWSLDRIDKEISKCDILCANCHRKLHYEQRNMPSKLIR